MRLASAGSVVQTQLMFNWQNLSYINQGQAVAVDPRFKPLKDPATGKLNTPVLRRRLRLRLKEFGLIAATYYGDIRQVEKEPVFDQTSY